ncbi:MAG: hypothetical protein WCT04_00215 [Planctomycetota bacterium]
MKTKPLDECPELLEELRAQVRKQYREVRAEQQRQKMLAVKATKSQNVELMAVK